VTTNAFKVVIEPDDDRWHPYCPALVEGGCDVGRDARRGLRQPNGSVEVSVEPLVAVTA
jgi:hypothetical protein